MKKCIISLNPTSETAYISLIRRLREIFCGLGIKEAKDIVDVIIKHGLVNMYEISPQIVFDNSIIERNAFFDDFNIEIRDHPFTENDELFILKP